MEFLSIVLAIAAVIIVMMGVKRVPQGMEYTVERLGRYARTLKPGIRLIITFFILSLSYLTYCLVHIKSAF